MSRAQRTTRPKKLGPKVSVQIFREDQVDSLIDYDSQRAAIETGVEKAEESEYHLQQAIKASEIAKVDAKIKDAYIPTPPTIASDVQYDVLYPTGFQQPATYIRSSATVEDCAGVAYCMDEEDELALKLINGRLPAGQEPCTEDQFEEVMNFFEETAQAKQPFAVVDSPPVLPLEELQEQFDDSTPAYIRTFSKYLYDHWSSRRTATGNRGLAPRLKFETGQESDDSDPYVCFRRRELRQIRKTRNRDAQSAEKLRKLRLELETARSMLLMVKRRELLRKECLESDRQVFEQRQALRDTKRKLGIKGDEELLINQKKQKLPPGMTPNQAALAQQLRMPMAPGPGIELRTLEDVTTAREREIQKEIQINVEKHIRWNEGFVDKTMAPLTPEAEDYPSPDGYFRQAMAATEYLPTPPASISDDEGQYPPEGADLVMKDASRSSTPFRYASPADDDSVEKMPSFRRRIGRGGRIIIDRKLPRVRQDVSDDRFKFDCSDNDSDIDSNIDMTYARMSQRAYLLGNSAGQTVSSRRATIEGGGPSQSPSGPQTLPTPAPS
ncbi:enhancer of polycomb-like-domain-containing protein [Exophiala viscosa]|uniref:Enhancer of polycomb-like protein n=1 Tax=Exophiala viscosa TaxID=2486360 RepID=A0AAN6DJR2_9EURO|nr:enhancer of polycomb-like-domain-containing protein [Exophiala viscosa]KAI1628487.1 enhancer of polycomb-like-domain-containing protein [Exophiala viscosa]